MIMSNDAFLILFLILIGLMTIIPLFLRKFKIPDVIALLLVGMLIGPNGFDLLGRLTPLLSFLGTRPDVVEAHFADADQLSRFARTPFPDDAGGDGG